MAFDYINEAFKKLDLLEESMFENSITGINKLSDFMDNDDESIRVIDPEAEEESELKDSYIGKVITKCNICHSHIFENKTDIVVDDEGNVNLEKACPYCGEQEGFSIVGEIVPYSENKVGDDAETEVSEIEETEEEIIEDEPITEQQISRASARASTFDTEDKLTEDFKEVSIKTEDQKLEMSSDENGKVTVTTEPITNEETEETSAEMIAPVSDETEEEILSSNEVSEEEVMDETTEEEESDEETFDFDEIDEEGIDELGESYLRNIYENVKSFKTSSVGANDKAIVVEGVITFTSGAAKKTGFVFEAKDFNSKGQLRFSGYNKHLTESSDAFTLVGRVDNKKLFVESLKYNYTVDNEPVRGVVRRK